MQWFTTVDPHAENYYSWSPYHYAANNPIIITDPTGMDWYEDKDGNTMWQKGSDAVNGYKNVGANYTQNLGKGMSVTFTQQEATSMTFTGLDKNQFVSQGDNGTGCKDAVDNMLSKDGVNPNGGRINVVNADGNGVATNANSNASNGVKAIDKALENGHGIEVGVDYKPKQVNNLKSNGGDGMTDHFVAISSKTETLKDGQVTSKTYSFFDPRSNKANGTSSSNVFNLTNNKLTGSYKHNKDDFNYTITTIRTSK